MIVNVNKWYVGWKGYLEKVPIVFKSGFSVD